MPVKAVIFDLDGVIVSTDDYHYKGWKKLADEKHIPFDREINHRLRGVSRMESLDILLERSSRTYSDEEKVEMAERKNNYYRESLKNITPTDILPGVEPILNALRERGIKMAIGSSSKNSPMILERIGLADFFDATADGNDISNSKPDPEVFLLAAKRLGIAPPECLVVEDADAGVDAAIAGAMKCLAVGAAAGHAGASQSAPDMASITVDEIVAI